MLVSVLLSTCIVVSPTVIAHAQTPMFVGHLGAHQVLRGVQIAGRAGIPADATAVFANVTVTRSDGPGFLSFSDNFTSPDTSIVNDAGRGRTAANLALLKLNPAGQVDIYASAGADVIIDVDAYLTSTADIEPAQTRLLDSRNNPAAAAPAPLTKRVIPLGTRSARTRPSRSST